MRQCRVSHCAECGLLPGLGLVQAESRCVRDSVLTGGRYGEGLNTDGAVLESEARWELGV